MSELDSVDVKKQEAQAMWVFVKHCKRAILTVVLFGCLVIAAALLAAGVNLHIIPFIVVVWLAMIVYPFIQMIWIKLRTGLWWHSLNANADWIGISIVMGLLLYMMLYFVWPLVEGVPVYGARIGYEPLVLIIILPLFRSAFKSSTRLRARNERAQYGRHWLILGHVTSWDIFLFRIPHERA